MEEIIYEQIMCELNAISTALQDEAIKRMSCNEAQNLVKISTVKDDVERQFKLVSKRSLPLPLLTNTIEPVTKFCNAFPDNAIKMLGKNHYESYIQGKQPIATNSFLHRGKFRVPINFPEMHILTSDPDQGPDIKSCKDMLEIEYNEMDELIRLNESTIDRTKGMKTYCRIWSYGVSRIPDMVIVKFILDLFYRINPTNESYPSKHNVDIFRALKRMKELGGTPVQLKQLAYSLLNSSTAFCKVIENDRPTPQIAHAAYNQFMDYTVFKKFLTRSNYIDAYARLILYLCYIGENLNNFDDDLFSLVNDSCFQLSGLLPSTAIMAAPGSHDLPIAYIKSMMNMPSKLKFQITVEAREGTHGVINLYPIGPLTQVIDFVESNGRRTYTWIGVKWRADCSGSTEYDGRPISSNFTLVIETVAVSGRVQRVEYLTVYAGLMTRIAPYLEAVCQLLKIGFQTDLEESWYNSYFACPQEHETIPEGVKSLDLMGEVVSTTKKLKKVEVLSMHHTPDPTTSCYYKVNNGILNTTTGIKVHDLSNMKRKYAKIDYSLPLTVSGIGVGGLDSLKTAITRTLIERVETVSLYGQGFSNVERPILRMCLGMIDDTRHLEEAKDFVGVTLEATDFKSISTIINSALYKLMMEVDFKPKISARLNIACVSADHRATVGTSPLISFKSSRIFPRKRCYYEIEGEHPNAKRIKCIEEADFHIEHSKFALKGKTYSSSNPSGDSVALGIQARKNVAVFNNRVRKSNDDQCGPSSKKGRVENPIVDFDNDLDDD